ncbi:hypothetical protein Bbelb_115850 [Branchiostoma belcheri]|nr:hypothetical protein Bbelb_115850 [Branchiostoma belcheri]
MEEKIRKKLRLRLAEDIINDQVGGAGWTYLDIALQVNKYSPKTVLVKTRKCDQEGNIVLEPKAREKTSNYLVPRDPSDATILDDVSVQSYPKKTSWKQTYRYERSVSGNVSLKAVGLSAEGSRTRRHYVETTCTDLEHRSVDIEDLRNALCALSAQTSAEGMKDETSFLVVTDVLVGKDVSIVEMIDKQKDIKASVKDTIGGGTKGETSNQESHNTEDIVLAIKLARVHYDKDGVIKRDSVVVGGSYEGNYTLGFGNYDREQHYAVKILAAKPLGVNENRFQIRVSLLGQQNSAMVLVTDLEEDKTYIFPCNYETSLRDHLNTYNYRWVDCKEWREAIAGQEFHVTFKDNPCNVYADDPIVRVFGDRPFSDRGEIRWRYNGNPYSETVDAIIKKALTFKQRNIQANAWGGGEGSPHDELELEFVDCQVTLRVLENERINTLLEKVMSLWVVFQDDQMVDRYEWDREVWSLERDAAQGGPNKLVIKPDVQPDDDATGLAIELTVPAGRLKITDCYCENVSRIMHRLSRVYALMNVVHDGKVITDLTQTYRQLGIQATAHVQLQSWDPENPPVVPSLEEVEEIENATESLIQELQDVEQGNEDSDTESDTIAKEPTEKQNVWSAVRCILWRHLEVRDGDPDIPPGALAMLIRAVGEDTVAGEVLQTILEAALERQGEGGTEQQGEGGTEQQVEGGTEQQGEGGTEQQGEGATEQQGEGATEQQGEGGTEQQGEGGTEQQGEGATEQQGEGGTEQQGEGGMEQQGEGATEHGGGNTRG